MKKIIIAIIISFIYFQNLDLKAQIYNIWALGPGRKWDFSTFPPKVSKTPCNGKSSASVCDSSGKLVCYLAGDKLFNKFDQKIENEKRLNIYSFPPVSFYNACILPKMNNDNKYMLIYKSIGNLSHQTFLSYSIINMDANGGAGRVENQNEIITTDSVIAFTVCRDDIPNSYLIIALIKNDSFFIYRAYNNTISLVNKIKIEIPINPDWYAGSYYYYNGEYIHPLLICSNNEKKLIYCRSGYFFEGDTLNGNDHYYIYIMTFDINKLTNSVENGETLFFIDTNNIKAIGSKIEFRGTCISPNDTFLYILGTDSLYQFDVFSKTFIQHSLVPDSAMRDYYWGMKLGPDQRIYILSECCNDIIINQPNKKLSASDLTYRCLNYSGNDIIPICYESIPITLYENLALKFNPYQNCNKYMIFKNKSNFAVFKEFIWYFSNQDSIQAVDASYEFPHSGKYFVKIKGISNSGYSRTDGDSVEYFKPPTANFTTDTTIGCQWLKFRFYDASVKDTVHPLLGESWLWDFGDGTTDTVKNPEHIYTKTGKYNVRLIYSNGFCSDTIEKEQAVKIIEAPRPGFKMSQTNYCSPYTLQITDTSLGRVISWHYDFGDGTDTNIANPAHLYQKPGNYKIVQTLTGPTGCVTKDSAYLHLRKGYSGKEEVNSLTATVDSARSILILWQSLPESFGYNIFKSDNEVSFYKYLTLNDTFYTDFKVKPAEQVYTYKITAFDSCNRPSAESRVMRNILLTGKSFNNDYSVLYWTPYELWQYGVKEYLLEFQDSSGQWQSLSSSSNKKFTDYNFFTSPNQFEKCYRIRAIEYLGNQQQSLSNILCLPYQPVLFIPNAFTPNDDGINDNFVPIGISIQNFNLKIFNRWGEKLFESSNQHQGWDGNFKNQNCPAGVYTFVISVTFMDGKTVTHTGMVTLIR